MDTATAPARATVSDEIGAEAGRALRRARENRGLRLKDVRGLSRGAFTPTAVAGYERAERAITLDRFCRLCLVYGVRPERLLAEIMRKVESRPEVTIDLAKIDRLPPDDARFINDFVGRVAVRRREGEAEVMRLRSGDLEMLATAANRSPDELLAEIGH